jgi:hypothetical protein
MKQFLVFALLLLLADCTTAPTTVQTSTDSLFNDSLFAPPSEHIGPENVFDLSEGMKDYLSSEIGSRSRMTDKQHALVEALYSKAKLKIEYDSTMTRNASEAFETRSGNCLSLVLLTASFAKAMGMPVQYQSVYSDQAISRSGGIIYLSGHVNLTLGSSDQSGSRLVRRDTSPLTIDFLPSSELGRQHVRVIRENTIVAMYLNNRAAEALAVGKIDDGYWWSRQAIKQDSTLLSAYNTLGVIYRRHGNPEESERILKYAIEREPGNTAPVSNLILALNDLGHTDEAQKWAEKLKKMDLFPPFYFFDKGLRAMKDKRYAEARELFAKEVERAAYHHEFHAWLAAAYYELGELDPARKHLTIALQNSTTPAERKLYAERLETIGLKARTSRGRESVR